MQPILCRPSASIGLLIKPKRRSDNDYNAISTEISGREWERRPLDQPGRSIRGAWPSLVTIDSNTHRACPADGAPSRPCELPDRMTYNGTSY